MGRGTHLRCERRGMGRNAPSRDWAEARARHRVGLAISTISVRPEGRLFEDVQKFIRLSRSNGIVLAPFCVHDWRSIPMPIPFAIQKRGDATMQRAEKSIRVNAPAEQVYQYWRNFEN